MQRRWFSDPKPSSPKEEPSKTDQGSLGGFVPALRRVTNFNVGDMVSVYGIAVLIVAIVFAPFVTNQMIKSDSTYEDLDTDDTVSMMDSMYRRIKLEEKWRLGIDLPNMMNRRPGFVDSTIDLFTQVIESEELENALASLVTRVLDSEHFQKACETLLKNLWNDLVNDPETTAQIVQLLLNAIDSKEIQRALKKLVMMILEDKEVYDELTRLLVRLGREKEVLEATQNLLTESAHNALNDPEILDHSMEFATDVVGDDIVQRTSGEALRNTVSYAVLPGFSTVLSMLGISLFLIGMSALFNSRASEYEAAIVEKAMSYVARSIQTTSAEVLSAIVSLPGRFLSTCFSLFSKIVHFPVQILQNTLSKLGSVGEATLRGLAQVVRYVAGLPMTLFWKLAGPPAALLRVLASTFGRIGKSLTDGVSRSIHGITAAVSTSFIGKGIGAIFGASNAVTGIAIAGCAAYAQSFDALVSSITQSYHAVLSESFVTATVAAITKYSDTFAASSGATAYFQSFDALTSIIGEGIQSCDIWINQTVASLTAIGGNLMDSASITTHHAVQSVTNATARLETWIQRFIGDNNSSNPLL